MFFYSFKVDLARWVPLDLCFTCLTFETKKKNSNYEKFIKQYYTDFIKNGSYATREMKGNEENGIKHDQFVSSALT